MANRLRWVATWLTWLALAGVASANYDGRAAELRDKLTAAQLSADVERQKLADAVDKYIAARNDGLTQLVHVVEETSTSNLEQERQWLDRVVTMRQDLARNIGDSLRDVSSPSVGALAFRQIVFVEEDKFLSGLVDVKVAEARDQIVANHQRVEEMKRTLDEKWRALREQDQSIDAGEKQVVDELNELVSQAVAEVASERKSFREKFVTVVSNAAKLPVGNVLPIPDWLDVFLQLVDNGGSWWSTVNDGFESRRQQYQRLVEGERGGILVLFKGIRDQTQDFVDKNNFDRMKKRYDEARSKLDDWRSNGAVSSGQRRDADDFGRDILAKLSSHLSATESAYNEFVRANEKKFFGPVGPDVREELVETKIWEDRVKLLQGRDLDSRLREWRSDVDNWWLVDLSPLTSDTRDWLKSLIRERVQKLVDAEQKLSEWNGKLPTFFDRKPVDDDIK